MRLHCSTESVVDRIVDNRTIRLDPSIVEEAISMVLSMVLDIEDCDEIMVIDESNYYHYANAARCYIRDTCVVSDIVKRTVDYVKKTIVEMRMAYITDFKIMGGWLTIHYKELGSVENNLHIPGHYRRSA